MSNDKLPALEKLVEELEAFLESGMRFGGGKDDDRNFQPGAFRPVLQISTDSFAAFPEAVHLAFGQFAKFGVLIREYKNATMNYTPSDMVGTKRIGIRGITEGEKRSICTSHFERNNLMIRTFMKRFTRLALGFSTKIETLKAAVNLHVAYFNFCWRPGKMRVSPAMKAGGTNRLWKFDELLS